MRWRKVLCHNLQTPGCQRGVQHPDGCSGRDLVTDASSYGVALLSMFSSRGPCKNVVHLQCAEQEGKITLRRGVKPNTFQRRLGKGKGDILLSPSVMHVCIIHRW